MARIEDHDYLKICGELATCLSISIASARRKVELAARQDGIKDSLSLKALAKRLLKEAQARPQKGAEAASFQLDQLLVALAEEENFMLED